MKRTLILLAIVSLLMIQTASAIYITNVGTWKEPYIVTTGETKKVENGSLKVYSSTTEGAMTGFQRAMSITGGYKRFSTNRPRTALGTYSSAIQKRRGGWRNWDVSTTSSNMLIKKGTPGSTYTFYGRFQSFNTPRSASGQTLRPGGGITLDYYAD